MNEHSARLYQKSTHRECRPDKKKSCGKRTGDFPQPQPTHIRSVYFLDGSPKYAFEKLKNGKNGRKPFGFQFRRPI